MTKPVTQKIGSYFRKAVVAVAGATVLMSSMAAGNAFAADHHQGGPQLKTGPSLGIMAAQNNAVLQQNGIAPDGGVGLKTENVGGDILRDRMVTEQLSKQIGKTVKMSDVPAPKVAESRKPGMNVKGFHL